MLLLKAAASFRTQPIPGGLSFFCVSFFLNRFKMFWILRSVPAALMKPFETPAGSLEPFRFQSSVDKNLWLLFVFWIGPWWKQRDEALKCSNMWRLSLSQSVRGFGPDKYWSSTDSTPSFQPKEESEASEILFILHKTIHQLKIWHKREELWQNILDWRDQRSKVRGQTSCLSIWNIWMSFDLLIATIFFPHLFQLQHNQTVMSNRCDKWNIMGCWHFNDSFDFWLFFFLHVYPSLQWKHVIFNMCDIQLGNNRLQIAPLQATTIRLYLCVFITLSRIGIIYWLVTRVTINYITRK